MAAGKNDVIKLLPPLTLSQDEAPEFLGALDAVLADVHGPAGRNWRVVRKIATTTLTRRVAGERPAQRRPAATRRADRPTRQPGLRAR